MPRSTPLPERSKFNGGGKAFQIRVPGGLVVHRATLTSRINGRGTELNEGGMCVFAGVELNVGDQIELEFSAPYAPQSLRVWALVKEPLRVLLRAGIPHGKRGRAR